MCSVPGDSYMSEVKLQLGVIEVMNDFQVNLEPAGFYHFLFFGDVKFKS